jgi:hypothetical protein
MLDWGYQNQNSDLRNEFLLGFCIDHKYLKMVDWWYLEKTPFLKYNYFLEQILNVWKNSCENTSAKLIVSTILKLDIWFFVCSLSNKHG